MKSRNRRVGTDHHTLDAGKGYISQIPSLLTKDLGGTGFQPVLHLQDV